MALTAVSNQKFEFAMVLNEVICDVIDKGATESRDIAVKVTLHPRMKELIETLERMRAARPSTKESERA